MRTLGGVAAACVGTLALGGGTASARVVGDGTARSCTSAAVVAAVRAGGHPPQVTLSGGGKRRILYMNTCDPAQKFTTSHCQDQATPRLTVKDIAFERGNATGERFDGGGGGAIFARGGRLRILRSTFTGNRCDSEGPDLGGGAVRVLSQYHGRAVDVTSSRFTHNVCSNGGALSSIAVSWNIVRSRFTGNRAIGRGANPAHAGTPGGGSGGAIYNDGNRFALKLTNCRLWENRAREGGGAIFFVSNDRTGTLAIARSRLEHNPSQGFETRNLPGIFYLGAGKPAITDSVLR